MTPREAATNANLLLVAGHDSTVNTISHCVMCTLRTPGCLELLRSRPELDPRRHRGSPAPRRRRSSSFPAGPLPPTSRSMGRSSRRVRRSTSCTAPRTATRKRFPNPNTFDPERQDNQHFGWGSGIHTCFGGPLARLEVNIAFETFLRRVENPRLVVDPPPYRRSNVFRGPEHLLIDFDRIRD